MGRRKQRNLPNLLKTNLNKMKFPNTLGTLAWNVKMPNLLKTNLNKRKFPNTLGTLAWNVKIKINNIHILVSPFSKCLRWWVKLQNNKRGNRPEKRIPLLPKLMLANTSINIISI